MAILAAIDAGWRAVRQSMEPDSVASIACARFLPAGAADGADYLRCRGQTMAQSPMRAARTPLTAMALGVPVVTQDSDYVEIPGLPVIKV